MKKILFCALLALTAFLFSSCDKKAEALDNLREYTEYLKDNSKDFTKEDWREAKAQYEEIIIQLEEYDFTDEEDQEIGRLKAICYKYISRGAMKQWQKDLNDLSNQAKGFIEEMAGGIISEEGEDGEETTE